VGHPVYIYILNEFVGLYTECSNCHIGLGMYKWESHRCPKDVQDIRLY